MSIASNSVVRTWNAVVTRDGSPQHLGQVQAANEPEARLAALSKYGLSEEDLAIDALPMTWPAILPMDDFAVFPA